MDGDTNIHRLRVISFGKKGTGKDYFVEQVGDNFRNLIPSKKISIKYTSSHPEIHTSTAREQRDSFQKVKLDQRTNEDRNSHLQVPLSVVRDQEDTFFQMKTNQITNNAKDDTKSRPEAPTGTVGDQYNQSHVNLSPRRNNITRHIRYHQDLTRIKDETGPNDAFKLLTVDERRNPQRQSSEVCKHSVPKRHKEELALLTHRSPSPKRARSNSKLRKLVQINERKFDPQPAKRPKITKVARKSTNIIFRFPIKRKVKKHSDHRIFNVDDAKRRISHSLRCSDHIKQIFKRGNTSKLKIKNNHQTELNSETKKNDDVKVLFLQETSKITDPRDRSQSSKDDVFGFRKCNRFRSTISVYQQHMYQLPRSQQNQSIRLWKPRKSCSTEHIPLRMATSCRLRSAKSADSSHPFNTHVHRVNVVEFPQDTSGFWNDRFHRRKKTSYHNIGVDPSVVLYSSPIYKCNDAGCDTHLKPIKSVGLNPENVINGPVGSCGDPACVPLENEIEVPSKRDSSVLTVVKYILFGLAILVWSPCIVMVVICWLITYPLRPSCIRAQVRARSGMYPECCVYPASERGFWSSFVKWIKSAEWYNRGAYQALASLIKKTKECNKENVDCKHQQLPNPNRQYSLYHSKDRGWIMKPVRLQNEGKKKEILNAVCDPTKNEKKRVRINAPADSKVYKAVPPTKVEHRLHKKTSSTKDTIISSQPKNHDMNTQQPQRYAQYLQPSPQPPPLPCPGACTVPPGKEHTKPESNIKEKPKKVRKPKATSPILDSTPSSLKVNINVNTEHPAVSQPRHRAFDTTTKEKKGTTKNPAARPPCVPCRLRILDKLTIGTQTRYAKQKHDDPKSKLKTKKKQQKALKEAPNPSEHDIKTKKQKQKPLKEQTAEKAPTLPLYKTNDIGRLKHKKQQYDEKRKSKRRKDGNCCIRYCRSLRNDIDELEKTVWFPELKCGQLWVQTLKKKPCFWIYKRWPSLYPGFLQWRKNIGSCCHILIFCLATFIWFPPIFCCYLCMEVFCNFF